MTAPSRCSGGMERNGAHASARRSLGSMVDAPPQLGVYTSRYETRGPPRWQPPVVAAGLPPLDPPLVAVATDAVGAPGRRDDGALATEGLHEASHRGPRDARIRDVPQHGVVADSTLRTGVLQLVQDTVAAVVLSHGVLLQGTSTSVHDGPVQIACQLFCLLQIAQQTGGMVENLLTYLSS